MTIDKILIAEVDENIPSNECAVLLSGGVDALSVAFSAHQLGKKVNAYSFQLPQNPSYDYAKAKEVSDIMGWKFTGINIPTENLIEDFHILTKLGCKKKTHYECVYPFLYVYPKIEEHYVLSGWGADGYYGISRTAILRGGVKDNKISFDAFRDAYFQPEQCAGYAKHKLVSDKYGKSFVTPYLSKNVKEFFYQYDWYELNKPYQKHHVRNAFATEMSMIGKVEEHSNLQLNAGIDTLFATLLYDKEINFRERTRMMDVYKDWQKGTLQPFL